MSWPNDWRPQSKADHALAHALRDQGSLVTAPTYEDLAELGFGYDEDGEPVINLKHLKVSYR